MTTQLDVFRLLGETSASINPLARDTMLAEFKQLFSEQRFYQPTFLAYQLDPRPLSTELYCDRTPYTNPAVVPGLLADTAEAGYLERTGKQAYLVSEQGRSAVESLHRAFYSRINQVNQFPGEKLAELAELLSRLVEAAAQGDQIPDGAKFCLAASHNGHPQVEPASLAQIDQLLDDLNAFRDDAHVAAWKPAGVDGLTWETLSFIWNREALTAEKLVERLSYRNYPVNAYQSALDDLAARGWIAGESEGYQVTDAGRTVREDAESETNKIYFKSWDVLGKDELERLADLLMELKEVNLEIVRQAKAD